MHNPQHEIDDGIEALNPFALAPPSLAWALRWSAGGGDPVTNAWETSLDYHAMLRLAWAVADDNCRERIKQFVLDSRGRTVPMATLGEILRNRAAEVRALIPPPTLEQYLAARRDDFPSFR